MARARYGVLRMHAAQSGVALVGLSHQEIARARALAAVGLSAFGAPDSPEPTRAVDPPGPVTSGWPPADPESGGRLTLNKHWLSRTASCIVCIVYRVLCSMYYVLCIIYSVCSHHIISAYGSMKILTMYLQNSNARRTVCRLSTPYTKTTPRAPQSWSRSKLLRAGSGSNVDVVGIGTGTRIEQSPYPLAATQTVREQQYETEIHIS